MAAATAVRYERGSEQFGGVFSEVWLVAGTGVTADMASGNLKMVIGRPAF